ncbi:hypothetical protein S83_031980 [Arachis hypogaea]
MEKSIGGQTGHYYTTCCNPSKDPNWKPMTKKEKRALNKTVPAGDSAITTQNQVDEGNNPSASAVGTSMDHVTKAKNQKKKLPKSTPKRGIVVGQRDEIPFSQSAPQIESI